MIQHDGINPYSCPDCGQGFPRKDALQCHVASVHEGKKLYPCSLCNMEFNYKTNLKRHFKTNHDHSSNNLEENGMSTNLDGLPIKEEFFGNGDDNTEFSDVNSLVDFIKSERSEHLPLPANMMKKVSDSEKQINGSARKSRAFHCNCGVLFTLKESLLIHIKEVHEGVMPEETNQCNTCGDSLVTR